MRASRENDVYLPGSVPATWRNTSFAAALDGAEIVLGVMPSHRARGVYQRMARCSTSRCCWSAHQGFGNGIAASYLGSYPAGGGGNFARRSQYSQDPPSPKKWLAVNRLPWLSRQRSRSATESNSPFSGRVSGWYTTRPDGVEIGGAVRNVVAIGRRLPWSGTRQPTPWRP